MRKKYHQLTIEEREKLQKLLWERHYSKQSLSQIAQALGRDRSTIVREVRRNGPPLRLHYTPRLAHGMARRRIKKRGERLRLKCQFIRDYVEKKLILGWSPEQIAGRLAKEHPGYSTNHESIYQYIYAKVNIYGVNRGEEDLREYLRRGHKIRRKRKNLYHKRGIIPNRIGIEERPLVVEARRELGHWEGDSVMGRKENKVALNALVERVSGLTKLSKIANLTASETAKVITGKLSPLPEELRLTLTMDNGTENAGHEEITKAIGTKCYFAHPYSAWERAINENAVGLVRSYFPKKSDFANVSEEEVQKAEYLLNTRPRKRHGWRTPEEVFREGVKEGVALKH